MSIIPNYLNAADATTIKALAVARQLQDWISGVSDGGIRPETNVVLSEYTLTIRVGECVVWNEDENDDDELTFESCRDAYIGALANLGIFVQMAAKRFVDDLVAEVGPMPQPPDGT